MARTPDVLLNIELKNSIEPYPGMEREVDALVSEFGLADRVWYSSFNHLSLVAMAATGTSVGLGALYEEQLVRPLGVRHRLRCRCTAPDGAGGVDEAMVAAAHAHGLRVHTWTVDRPEDVAALAAIGVDAIITNVPDVAPKVLAGSWPVM